MVEPEGRLMDLPDTVISSPQHLCTLGRRIHLTTFPFDPVATRRKR